MRFGAAAGKGSHVRFDDSLKTVLAADVSTAFGAQSAFRQLVDMAGRGRIPTDDALIERLAALRATVPAPVRAAAARALALARPDAALVAFFAADDHAIAATLLRSATLTPDAWTQLLPRLDPAGRGVLRQRRDLDPAVERALEAFGAVDFVLSDGRREMACPQVAEPVLPAPPVEPPVAMAVDALATPPSGEVPPEDGPLEERPFGAGAFGAGAFGAEPFVALGDVARALPVVALARHRAVEGVATEEAAPRFEIADLVDRINAFQQSRDGAAPPGRPDPPVVDMFRFESDASGLLRWTDHPARGALIGLSLGGDSPLAARAADGVASGALRQRAGFTNARLIVPGGSVAAGAWRISAVPVFDPASGRFQGHRGTARRPRPDEDVVRPDREAVGSESLRRLVHELRTPTTAIAGFAELIESELFGPVPAHYRERARLIGSDIGGLIAAIEDLDTAARIEAAALDMRPGSTMLRPALARILEDLAPLSRLRGCTPTLDTNDPAITVAGDERVVERLLSRLMATLVAAGGPGEPLGIRVAEQRGGTVEIRFDRPRALAAIADETWLAIDAEAEAEAPGAPLLGTGFAIRLARNLAVQLGGSLAILPDALQLVLPVADAPGLGQATSG